MCAASIEIDADVVELRQQAHYWRAVHGRAVERETVLKQQVVELQRIVREQQTQLTELTGQLDAAKAQLVTLEQLAFGAKCDNATAAPATSGPCDGHTHNSEQAAATPKRKRGQQPGAPGHGRKRRGELDTEVIVHDVPAAHQCCPTCEERP